MVDRDVMLRDVMGRIELAVKTPGTLHHVTPYHVTHRHVTPHPVTT
jgi:hypothetical protein